MRLFERCLAVLETMAIAGPANLAGVVAMACVSGVLLGLRLLTQGYHRALFSSK